MDLNSLKKSSYRFSTLDDTQRHLNSILSVTKEQYYAVMDSGTKKVIYFTTRFPVAQSITDHYNLFTIPLFGRRLRVNPVFDKDTPPWTYSITQPDWRLSNTQDEITEQELERYKLLNRKFLAIDHIYTPFFFSGYAQVHFQYHRYIYDEKYKQAKLVESGITDYEKTYYIHGWAEIENIDLETSAKNIIFLHEEMKYKIFLTENLRQKYTKRIKEAISAEEIDIILGDHEKERMLNSAI